MLSYNSDQFFWRGNMGTADVSGLGPSFRADGFKVVSSRTGNVVNFFRCRQDDVWDDEGQLLTMVFRPSTGPLLIKVFNT